MTTCAAYLLGPRTMDGEEDNEGDNETTTYQTMSTPCSSGPRSTPSSASDCEPEMSPPQDAPYPQNIFSRNGGHSPRKEVGGISPAFSPSTSTANNEGPNSMPGSPYRKVREHLFKILVIGELATGKTSFIKRYVHQFFSDHYRATIGVDFALKVINWDDHTLIRLQLWDIAGQERFGNMTRVYYKEAVGAFIVFDVARPPTFEAVMRWKNDLDTKVVLPDGGPVPVVLLANKCDQGKEGPSSNSSFLDTFCQENGFSGWYYTSSKNNEHVEESARFLVAKILQRQKALDLEDSDDPDVLNLDHQESRSDGKRCSC